MKKSVPAWSIGAVALGAVLVAVGAALLGIAAIASIKSKTYGHASLATFAAGGAAVAIGWCGMFASGVSGFGTILGALAVPAASITAATLSVPAAYAQYLGLIWLAGAFIFVMTHYFALGEGALAKLQGARGCAALAMLGLGAELLAFSKRIPLPSIVMHVIAVVGLVGLALFGLVLAATVGAVRRT